MARFQQFVKWMGSKEFLIRMFLSRPRRLLLLSLLVFLPGTAGFCFLAWRGLESDLAAEHRQIFHFEELAAYRVVNSVGFELFYLHFNFSFRIRELLGDPDTDWPQSIASMVRSFRQRDRYPDLLQDVVLATEPPKGQLKWSLFAAKGWETVEKPGWTPSTEAMFQQISDPQVSLDRPVLVFALPPEGHSRRVLLIRYRVQEVLERIVPTLAASAFARGAGKYDFSASVIRRGDPSFDAAASSADWVIPLVPDIPFSEWLRTYLNRQADYLQTPEPEIHYLREIAQSSPNQTLWALQVKLLPEGLAAYSKHMRGRNLFLVGLLFVVLWVAVGLFLYALFRVFKASARERTFVTLVSHELKTPLAAVRALSENLAGGYVGESERIKEYGAQIVEQTGRLETMVGNILSLTNFENPDAEIPQQGIDVGTLIRPFVDATGWKVAGADQGWKIWGNQAALEAALDNLVSNAQKYGTGSGPPPEIAVAAGRLGQPKRWVGISVIDHGPGLTARERRDAGFRFRKGAAASAGQIPGSGLGLSLVRTIMGHLRGRMQMRVTPGGGLTVTLWLREWQQR